VELAECARASLRRLGARLPGDESPYFNSPIVADRFEGSDASWIARELKAHRVLISARHNNLRVSPHFYNNEDDIQRLARALHSIL